ncbi:MAG: hypothetical protein IKU55_00485 [Clostridia bacterium]|nr:hypothetical protein [Clostridia bacterium]
MTWSTVFDTVWEMSLTGGIVVAAILVTRLFLKRAPKVFSYALWGVVLFRLLCPFTLSLPFSLFSLIDPMDLPCVTRTESVVYESHFDSVPPGWRDEMSAIQLPEEFFYTAPLISPQVPSAIPIEDTESFPFTAVWTLGMAVMAIYGVVAWVRLRRRLIGFISLDRRIRLTDHIDSPFVFGLFRPRIYLPSDLPQTEYAYVVRHEQTHLRRGDHVFRFLAYVALCIHWFNPLVWAAFIVSERDMEMSCDEAVLRGTNREIRADYAASLLRFATSRRVLSTPIGFGEGNPKGRIRNMMRWKRPKLWLILLVVCVCIAIAAVCLFDPVASEPMTEESSLYGYDYDVSEITFSHGYFRFDYTSLAQTPDFRIDQDGVLWILEHHNYDHALDTWLALDQLQEIELTEANFAQGFGPIDWRNENVTSEQLLAQNDCAWVVDIGGTGLRYYLLEQIDGSLYLACWYPRTDYSGAEGSGDVLVRWLFALERGLPVSNIPAQTVATQATTTEEVATPVDVNVDPQIVHNALADLVRAELSQNKEIFTHFSARNNTPATYEALQASDVWLGSHAILSQQAVEVSNADGTVTTLLKVYAQVLSVKCAVTPQGVPPIAQIALNGYNEYVNATFVVNDDGTLSPKSFAIAPYSEREEAPDVLEALMQSVYAQAVEHFAVDTDEMIGALLKKAASYAKIYPQRKDFEHFAAPILSDLRCLGQYTLEYCLRVYSETDELQTNLMALVCSAILQAEGKAAPTLVCDAETAMPQGGAGTAWFDAYALLIEP